MLSAKTKSTSYPLSDTAPLAIDLYCGLGGWAEGFLSEGWRVIGFDIERHDYGTGGYPGQLVIQDVRTLHGSQFKDAAVIVASPPCQAYSYRAMPWKRAKALPPPDNTLFNECFRIQREACQAAGRHIPLIVENVRGAQRWVGPASWAYKSFHLWGDVPAVMPIPDKGFKGFKRNWRDCEASRQWSSRDPKRKQWSAQIAKIPFPLAQHIARVFKPVAASLLLIASLSGSLSPLAPARKGTATHMFVLAEIARKRYAQFGLDFETSVRGNESQTAVTSQSPVLEPGALPPVLDELAKKFRPFIDRVMARLSEAERQEINTHYQADYRQSWICLSFANRRIAEPFVSSSYQMYGIHPSKVWERIVADRKERLGAEYYDWYSSDDLLRPDVPKIPASTVSGRTAVGLADPNSQACARLEPEIRTGVFVSLPEKIPPTATADIHAANGADLLTGKVGSVPINKEVV